MTSGQSSLMGRSRSADKRDGSPSGGGHGIPSHRRLDADQHGFRQNRVPSGARPHAHACSIKARTATREQIIILRRHADRIALAREFGATEVVSERVEEAAERVRELTDGFGVHSVLESVGLEQSMLTAIGIARPGGAVGRVGLPQDETTPASQPAFFGNVAVGGGPAPVRGYIEELLPDVLEGRIEPERVFDRVLGLDEVPDGYRAMNEREAIKVMVEL